MGSPRFQDNFSDTSTRRSRGGTFISTLKKDREDLSPQSVHDLEHHNVSRELSEQIFARFKPDEETVPLRYNLEHHAAPGLSRTNYTEEELEDLESYQNIKLDRLCSGDSDADSFEADGVPSYKPLRKLEKAIPPSRTLASLTSPLSPRSPPDMITDYPFSYQAVTVANRGRAATAVRLERPAVILGEPERIVPRVCVENDAAENMRDEEVEQLLDDILPAHAAEFLADQNRIHHDPVTEKEREDEIFNITTRSFKGCTHHKKAALTPQERGEAMLRGQNPSPDPDPYHCDECQYEKEQKIEFLRRQGGVMGDGFWNEALPQDREALEFEVLDTESIADSMMTEEVFRDPPAYQRQVHGRRRSHSQPVVLPTMPEEPEIPRAMIFPSGSWAPFTCIFGVVLATEEGEVPVSSQGRPLVPDIPEDQLIRLSIVATLHPESQYVLMDVLDYDKLPRGFRSEQIVDLIELQMEKYMIPFMCWPRISGGPDSFIMADQWSVCSTTPSGIDWIWASSINVAVQRIVGCLVRLGIDTYLDPKEGKKILDKIDEDRENDVTVTVRVKTNALSTKGTRRDTWGCEVPPNFKANAVFDWHLPTKEQLSLQHSRAAHPPLPMLRP